MDYKNYQLNRKEKVEALLVAGGITLVIAVLFYRSGWACILLPCIYLMVKNRIGYRKEEARRQQIKDEFCNGIRALNIALQAGIGMERAWKEVEKETKLLYGNESLFYQELIEINHSVAMNIPIEKLLMEFANRTGIEDIIQFAEIFDYGKRSGGNWKKLISTAVYRLSEKNEVRKQIEVMVAEKKLEQQIMNVIPLGILAFLQVSSWDYMRVMYHNLCGVVCMSFVLFIYGVSISLSEKILEIKV